MMQQWSKLYLKEKGVQVNYQSKGSGAGIDMMTNKQIDFGCTDAPLNEEQLAKAKATGGEVIHIPVVLGAVVPAYNLPGVEEQIRFSGAVLADIFLNKIQKWNDPALKALNPNINLPDLNIAVVHRSDSSGTTFIWTDYLAKVSPEWKKVGAGTAIEWPCGVGMPKNDGVAGQIQRASGALGYIELIYALNNNIKYGSVQNRAGEFITADLKSVTAAANLALADIPDDLRFSLTNAPGKEAYPISGTVWAILYVHQPADKAKPVAEFLRWVTHEGQSHTEALHYARLPEGLAERGDAKLKLIQAAK
jgi:phosphate transport system substrate-binding protein